MSSEETSWSLLEKYQEQSEARIVESFLKAQGFEVQLLDTHTFGAIPFKGLGSSVGMRLMIRSDQLEKARAALNEAQRGSHLEVVDGHKPPKIESYDRIVVILIALLVLIVYLASHFK